MIERLHLTLRLLDHNSKPQISFTSNKGPHPMTSISPYRPVSGSQRPASRGQRLAFRFVPTDQRSRAWQDLGRQLPLACRWEAETQGGRETCLNGEPASGSVGMPTRSSEHGSPTATTPRATPTGQPLDAQEQSRQEPCPRGGGGQEHLLGTTAYTKTGKEGMFPVSIGQSLRWKVSLRPDASSQPCCSPAPRLEPPSDCPRGHLLTRK